MEALKCLVLRIGMALVNFHPTLIGVLSVWPLTYTHTPRAGPWLGLCLTDLLSVLFVSPPSSCNQIDHIALIIELLGSVPRKLIMAGKYSKDFFTKKGKRVTCRGVFPSRSSEPKDTSHSMYFLTFPHQTHIRYSYSHIQSACCKHKMSFLNIIIYCYPIAVRLTWSSMVVCRWFETHHQTEAVGSTGGANWQVWVAPRRSRVLRGLPASHAGVGPRKESHSCRMPAPPLARPLVETSSLCTFPSSILSRDCNRSLSSSGISDNYLFVFIFVSSFFLDYLCFCYWINAFVYDCVGSSDDMGNLDFCYFCGHVGSNCCALFTHPAKQTVTVLLVIHPCLLHSSTKEKIRICSFYRSCPF